MLLQEILNYYFFNFYFISIWKIVSLRINCPFSFYPLTCKRILRVYIKLHHKPFCGMESLIIFFNSLNLHVCYRDLCIILLDNYSSINRDSNSLVPVVEVFALLKKSNPIKLLTTWVSWGRQWRFSKFIQNDCYTA